MPDEPNALNIEQARGEAEGYAVYSDVRGRLGGLLLQALDEIERLRGWLRGCDIAIRSGQRDGNDYIQRFSPAFLETLEAAFGRPPQLEPEIIKESHEKGGTTPSP